MSIIKQTAINVTGEKFNVHFNIFPDKCLRCHNNITPQFRSAIVISSTTNSFVHVAFQCTNSKCNKMIIGEYKIREISGNTIICDYEKTNPISFEPISFSEEINKISVNFVNIYNQALDSESKNLDLIAGVGLRKSLEYLIKDFCIHEHPSQESKIKKMFLGKVIQEFIEDTYLKKCAERATWLGNDETHYMRVWDNKDITDLKKLIKLSVNWIENVLLTENYIEDMPDKKNEKTEHTK